MAISYFNHRLNVGDPGVTVTTRYDAFIDDAEDIAQEVEAARETGTSGATSLVLNLANYVKYTLAAPIDGNGTYKCTNMLNGTDSQDYCTVAQANAIAATGGVATIETVNVGTLGPNDIVVVNTTGTAFTGRPTTYTNVPTSSLANGNYNMNLSGGSKVTNLPAGIVGMVISYADIGGYAGQTSTGSPNLPNLTITANGSEKIMNVASDPLVIDDYPYCSFDLVYTGATFGWTLARFQR